MNSSLCPVLATLLIGYVFSIHAMHACCIFEYDKGGDIRIGKRFARLKIIMIIGIYFERRNENLEILKF